MQDWLVILTTCYANAIKNPASTKTNRRPSSSSLSATLTLFDQAPALQLLPLNIMGLLKVSFKFCNLSQ